MILEQLTELKIVDVLDRGVPNKECIAISVKANLNTAPYGVLLGVTANNQSLAVPARDNFFWFGEGLINTGDWIFLYTGSGEPSVTRTVDGLSNIYTLYWGRPMTMFYNLSFVPTLFRMDSVQVAPVGAALPQG